MMFSFYVYLSVTSVEIKSIVLQGKALLLGEPELYIMNASKTDRINLNLVIKSSRIICLAMGSEVTLKGTWGHWQYDPECWTWWLRIILASTEEAIRVKGMVL